LLKLCSNTIFLSLAGGDSRVMADGHVPDPGREDGV